MPRTNLHPVEIIAIFIAVFGITFALMILIFTLLGWMAPSFDLDFDINWP
jgi:hypothetical protein